MTVQQLIDSAGRLANAIDSDQSFNATESAQAMEVANQILSNWSADGILIPSITQVSIAMTGAASYSTTSLLRILACRVENGGVSNPAEIVDAARFASAGPDIAETGSFAEMVYWNGVQGTGTLYPWPRPANGGTMYLQTLQALTAFGALSDNVTLPGAGYEHALRYALALALAREYGNPLDPATVQAAADAKNAIATRNVQVLNTAPPAA